MLLATIAFAAFISTMMGGMLALKLRDRLHLILGFSAGAVIGVAFFDLLPEALELSEHSSASSTIVSWTAFGFLLYLVTDRVLQFHVGAPVRDAHTVKRGFFGAAILCIHSFLDGVAIGLGFQASHAVGMVVAIAVLTHDFSDGINTMNIVTKNSGARRQALFWLLIDAIAPVAGVAATLLFTLPSSQFGVVLALFAGFFLYIGASDLIPESYHAHPKFLTTAMTLAGAAVLYLAMALVAHAGTVTVAGLEVDQTAQVDASTLVLNGAGKRTKYFFDVYVAALYVPAHRGDAAQVLDDAGPKRITMMLMRNLSAEQLSDALREGISLNSTPAELASVQTQTDALVAIMNMIGSAAKGDLLAIDFLADGTTRVALNGRPRGNPIAGVEFQRALLKVWLGSKPVQSDLKRALLGG
ncbi:MAG: chalcone isomerase family protein [Steroidobacteraceae bacterium]